jgi:tetratricopeptide (TPR) repeat protein
MQYQIGDRIGGEYEIRHIFGGEGKSGMGIVYECYDYETKSVFALKTFQDKYLSSKKMIDNFKKEAFAWNYLGRHPYIVWALHVLELDYRLFVVCEFIIPDDMGRNKLTHYFNGSISLKQTLSWSIQFCHGMEYAYSKGVTPHRDIKPDNIMITTNGIAKITDFGLAGLWANAEMAGELKELMDENRSGFTFIKVAKEKVVCGTQSWMAPEQFDGETDDKSDIYSFGVVMYQMASGGKLPFYPQAGDTWEIAHKTYPVLRIDSKLFPSIEKCLRKKPGERYKAFDELRKSLEDLYRIETGKEIVLDDPFTIESSTNSWEFVNKGSSLIYLRLFDEAIKECRSAIEIDSENPKAHFNLGIALKATGFVDKAIKEFKETLRIDPEHHLAHNNLGTALYDKGLLDEAIQEYRKAINTHPEHSMAYSNLGRALYKKGLLGEAIKEWCKAIEIYPDNAEAHNNLGVAFEIKGLIDEAIKEYKEAIRINHEFAEAHDNLGVAYKDKGLLNEAINEWREAIRINPEYAESHNNLGAALYAKGFLDEAIIEWEIVIRIDPDHAMAHGNVGAALCKKGLIDDGIKELKEAIRINPKYADAYKNLGIALHMKGLEYEAIEAFENFVRYAPPEIAELVEKVKEVIGQLKNRR